MARGLDISRDSWDIRDIGKANDSAQYLKSNPEGQPHNFKITTDRTMKTELTCTWIDTCYPDDLQDHHNRDSELLLCVAQHDDMTWLIQALFDQANHDERLPDSINHGKLIKAIREEFNRYSIALVCPDTSGSYEYDESEGEYYWVAENYVYAYLSW